MASLEIVQSSGETEQCELSKTMPVLIGRHTSSDVRVDEAGVPPLQCRISWNKTGYDVTAADKEGVELNGKLVRNARLSANDVIRVGSVDITVRDLEDDENIALMPEDEVTEAFEVEDEDDGRDLMPASYRAATPPPKSAPRKPSNPKAGGPSRPGSTESFDWLDEDDAADEADDAADEVDEDPADSAALTLGRTHSNEELTSASRAVPGSETGEDEPEVRGESALQQLKSTLKRPPRRPGEEDTLRSPFVLGLGIGLIVLALLAAVFWFIITRATVMKAYQQAMDEKADRKYLQAIKLLEEFLHTYPRHSLSESAILALGQSRIEKDIDVATPDWKSGLTALNDYIAKHQDDDEFTALHVGIAKYAQDIALGSLKTAIDTKERELLAVCTEATKLLHRFSPPEAPPTAAAKEIADTTRLAEAAILKQETFNAALADMSQAVEAKKPVGALQARRKLLDRYPEIATPETPPEQKLAARLSKQFKTALEAEKNLTVREDLNQPAVTEERTVVAPQPITLSPHTFASSPGTSTGRTVFAIAKDCCYGIDAVTGHPVWRRVIGFDLPFFPLLADSSIAGLLLFDTNHQELVYVDRQTGRLVWRQPLAQRVSGPPLLHEGQIFLPTLGGHLYKIDLQNGAVTSRLSFSQELLAPPVLAGEGKYLVVAGNAAVIYTLSVRPLECKAAAFFGHKTGSLKVPLLAMGKLVLMTENDRAASCRLRAIDAANCETGLTEIETNEQTSRMEGQVRDVPVLRGNQLFVSTGNERVAAFTVSDDRNQPTLTAVARFPGQTGYSGPTFLSAGADGQLWMASSAVRRFQLTTDSIVLDPSLIAVGHSSQPVQTIGERLYVGRRQPGSAAVIFTQVDREARPAMTSHWRTIVGSSVLACVPAANDSVLCLTETGDLFFIAANELKTPGFRFRAHGQLKLPEQIEDPLRAAVLADGRLVAYAGKPEPRLWIINKAGQVEKDAALDQPLQCPPAACASGLLSPLPGKLSLLLQAAGQPKADDFLVPVQQNTAQRWMSLKSVDDTHVVVADSSPKFSKLEFRTNPRPYLHELTSLPLDQPVDVGVAVSDGKLAFADAGKRLQILNASNMERLAETQLDQPASNDLWFVGEHLLVETARDRLHCYDLQLKPLWTLALDGQSLADRPLLHANQLVVAKQNGEVLAVDPAGGAVKNRIDVGQPLTLGPHRVGSATVVFSVDGSLYPIDQIFAANP